MSRLSTTLALGAILAILIGRPLAGLDRPQNHRPQKETGNLKEVPVGAIKIPLRDVQQEDDYSCGAAALMSICSYYNVGPRDIEGFKRKLKTDPDEGTYYKNLAALARDLGLKADIMTPMTVARLKGFLDRGMPVICSIQAYGDKGADYARDGNGHYVVAIGYDQDGNLYFMDSGTNFEGVRANPYYGYLSEKEFLKRWHEDEGMKGAHEPHRRLGIAIYPDPRKASPLLRARRIE
jgi:ABC-type bacteriocin/lantibiotic exporter with double-glycine peptidase domain